MAMWHHYDGSDAVDRRGFLKRLLTCVLVAAFGVFPGSTEAVRIFDVKSPKRRTRPVRVSTRFIILHTTETEGPGTLEFIARGGRAGYVVDQAGKIFRIMAKTQISIGCGRSMWNGLTNIDNHAINIETVGYHNLYPPEPQMASLRYLLRVLMKTYGISARNVMPHSQVAYGRPNRWYRRSHRGRKRCGMVFAMDPVRQTLGLSDKSRFDPDVRAKRLIVADPDLERVLYAKMDKREMALFMAKSVPCRPDSEDEEQTVRTIEEGQTVWEHAGDEYADETTIYLFPDGRISRGDALLRKGFEFKAVQPGTRIAVGYIYGGSVTAERTPYSIAGKSWDNPDTLYIIDGRITTGDEIIDKQILPGTILLFRK